MTRYLIFLLLIAILECCEFDAYRENFVEVEPPSVEGLNVQLLTSFNDTLKVFQDTEFSFSLRDIPSTSCHVQVKLQQREWNISSSWGSFVVRPDSFLNGIDTLIMDVYLGTGTGSIADRLGYENFWFQKKWTILVDHRPPPKITPMHGIDNNGFMKVYWPRCNQENFRSYQLQIIRSSGPIITKVITDRNASFYIDTSYIGGFGIYSLTTFVQGYSSGIAGSFTINDDSPAPLFESRNNYDSLRIFWNRSRYRCRFWLLDHTNKVVFTSLNDTSCTMVNPGFGGSETYTLKTSPLNSATWNNPLSMSQSKMYVLGERVAGNSPHYGYNRIEKTLYTNTYDEMECYDVFTMAKKRGVSLNMLIYQGLYSAPSNSTRIATITAKNIYVFPDQYLSGPVIIPYECFGKSIDHLALTDNGYITIGTPSRFEVFEAATGIKKATAAIADYPYYSKIKCMATSRDAKYLCSVSHLGMSLFRFEGDTLVKIHGDKRAYTSVFFSEKNINYLYLKLRGNDTLEIREAADFSLVRSVNLFQCVLCGFDPETGLLAASDLSWLYVLDPETFEVKYKIKCPTSFIDMYAGRLFSSTGYTLKIFDVH